MIYDILIIGGGPAGLTAATYGCRAGKSVLVLEKESFGGQITWSPRGGELPRLRLHKRSGAGGQVHGAGHGAGGGGGAGGGRLRKDGGGVSRPSLCASGAEFQGRSLIIAAGAKPRMLGLPRRGGAGGQRGLLLRRVRRGLL